MSEETPRLSRREMRERGLLKAVADDSAPSLTQTQELHLRRLSRKEMREREKASQSAVQAEIDAAELARALAAETAADPAKAEPSAKAAPDAKVVRTDAAASNVPASSDTVASTPDPGRKSVFERFSKPEETEEPAPSGSLEDRLLARVRQDTARSGSAADERSTSNADVDQAVKSYVAAIPSLDAADSSEKRPGASEAAASPASHESSAGVPEPTAPSTPTQSVPALSAPVPELIDDEPEYQPEKRREGIGGLLMTIILILIAILLGFLIGWAVNHFWLNAEGLPGSSLIDLHTSLQI